MKSLWGSQVSGRMCPIVHCRQPCPSLLFTPCCFLLSSWDSQDKFYFFRICCFNSLMDGECPFRIPSPQPGRLLFHKLFHCNSAPSSSSPSPQVEVTLSLLLLPEGWPCLQQLSLSGLSGQGSHLLLVPLFPWGLDFLVWCSHFTITPLFLQGKKIISSL